MMNIFPIVVQTIEDCLVTATSMLYSSNTHKILLGTYIMSIVLAYGMGMHYYNEVIPSIAY